jgi:hypothetical protein
MVATAHARVKRFLERFRLDVLPRLAERLRPLCLIVSRQGKNLSGAFCVPVRA